MGIDSTGTPGAAGPRTPTASEVVSAALAAGLAAGSIDLLVSMPRSPEAFAPWSELPAPLAVTALVIAALGAALWYGALRPLSKRTGSGGPLLAGLVAGVVFVFLVRSLLNFAPQYESHGLGWWRWVPALAGGAGIFLGVYLAGARLPTAHRARRYGLRLLAATPVALSALVILKRPLEDPLSPAGPGWFHYAAIAAMALLGVWTAGTSSLRLRRWLPGVVAAGWALAGGVAFVQRGPFLGTVPEDAGRGNHRIPRVILITIDTLRADALSCYDGPDHLTPRIDELARDSVLFRHAYSGGAWTLPGVASILTGLPTFAHGMYWFEHRLPDEFPTLAEAMRDAGYATAALVDNMVLRPRQNLYQGFQQYANYPKPWPAPGDAFGRDVLRRIAPWKYHNGGTEMLTRTAEDWIRGHGDREFFFWLHYFDPHAPHNPPQRLIPDGIPPASIGANFDIHIEVRNGRQLSAEERKWARKLYLAEVRYVDEQVGRLMDTLKELGIYDNALIVLTSDHGEEFWEHGGFEHGHAMYEEVLKVPLLIKLPRSESTGIVESRVSNQFVMPTILELCGISPAGRCPAAPSLASLRSGDDAAPEADIVAAGSCYSDNLEAIVFDNYKLIRRLGEEKEELYDLAADPGEATRLERIADGVLEEGQERLRQQQEWASEVRACYNAPEENAAKPGQEVLRRLKALGYIQ